jgi:hypothetical protein
VISYSESEKGEEREKSHAEGKERVGGVLNAAIATRNQAHEKVRWQG